MRRALPLALATALALAGCGAEETSGEATPADSGADAAVFGEGAVEHGFDQPYVYDDGLAVIVSAPQKYTPIEESLPENPPATFAVFTIRVENESPEKFQVGDIEVAMQSAGEDQVELQSPEFGLEGVPEQELITGGAREFRVVFGAESLDDVALLVAPGGDRDPLIFAD